MTVAIALQVHDGVVLASDSALTLTDPTKPPPDNVLNIYNNGNKIFNLHKGLPIGAAFYGAGSIGASSVPTLVKDLRLRFMGGSAGHKDWHIDEQNYTIEQVVERARQFLFEENFKPLNLTAKGAQFGFIVAGYSSGAQLSEVWQFQIVDSDCNAAQIVMPQGIASSYAGGEPDVFLRLANGVGANLPAALKAIGIDDSEIPAKMAIIQSHLATPLVEPPMPIQDAIELAEFFVNATATFTRFKRGAGTVGGPTESTAITKHEGFKWVKRKHYYDECFNPRGEK
ncbi:MAG: hypothetical protein WA733_01235 [Methylocystis sp.]